MVGSPSKGAVLGKLRTTTLGSNADLGITLDSTIAITAAKIDKLGLDIRSFREPLKRAIQEVVAPSLMRNFDEGGRPEAWDPLSEATLQIRAKAGIGGSQILVRSGLLKRTMGQLNIWDINTKSAILKALPEKIWYGAIQDQGYSGSSMANLISKLGHKGALQAIQDRQLDILGSATLGRTTGAKQQKGKRTLRVAEVSQTMAHEAATIPQRQFIMFQDEDEDAIAVLFIAWLDERIKLAGL